MSAQVSTRNLRRSLSWIDHPVRLLLLVLEGGTIDDAEFPKTEVKRIGRQAKLGPPVIGEMET